MGQAMEQAVGLQANTESQVVSEFKRQQQEEGIDQNLYEGYKTFTSLMDDLKGIFQHIYAMKGYKLKLGYYEDELGDIEKDFKLADGMLQANNILDEKFRIEHFEMYLTYETNALANCNARLKKLITEFAGDIYPVYNAYSLFTIIEKDLNEQGIFDSELNDEIIDNLIKLVDQVNKINTFGKVEVTEIIDKAYQTIYAGLLYEARFGKHRVLNHILELNLDANREKLGLLILADAQSYIERGELTRDEMHREQIKHISEGPGYDYLSMPFISRLSELHYGSLKQHYLEVQKNELDAIASGYKKYLGEMTALNKEISEQKWDIRKFKLNIGTLRVSTCAFLLIPLIAAGAGGFVGKKIGDNIPEFRTTTRTYNYDTGEEIGEPIVEYTSVETSYVATIEVGEPWHAKPGGGYIQEVSAYEFNAPVGASGDHRITEEDIKRNLRKKYTVSVVKEELGPEDSMTDTTVNITETFQDKTIHQPSTKYILPLEIASGVVAYLAVLFQLAWAGLINLDPNDGLFKFLLFGYFATNGEKNKKEKEKLEAKIAKATAKITECTDRKLELADTESELRDKVAMFNKNYGTKINVKQLKRIKTQDNS